MTPGQWKKCTDFNATHAYDSLSLHAYTAAKWFGLKSSTARENTLKFQNVPLSEFAPPFRN